MTKFVCDCGIREAAYFKMKSYRMSAAMNYREVFYHVPVCDFGHEMTTLCEECGEREKADGDYCEECQRMADVEAADFHRDMVAETRLLVKP